MDEEFEEDLIRAIRVSKQHLEKYDDVKSMEIRTKDDEFEYKMRIKRKNMIME